MAHTDDKKHRPSLTAVARNTISNEAHAESLRAYRVTALALKRGTQPGELKNPHPLPALARQSGQVELYGAWQHGQDEAVRQWRAAEFKEPGGPWAEYAAAITEAAVEAENEERAAQAVVEGHIKAGLDEVAPLEAKLKGDAPTDGRTACRTGWKRNSNPWPEGTVGHEQWPLEWDAEAAAMWTEWCDTPHMQAAQGKPAPVTAAIHGYRQQSPERQAVVNQAKLLEAQVLAYIDGLKGGISQELGDLASDMAAYQANGYQRLSVEEQTAKLAAFKERDTELNTALRWLSAGKTSIEVGFMEINRSTFRPQPVKAPE